MAETATGPEPPIRILLIDDDRDDYLLTRTTVAEIPNVRYHLDWVSNYEAALAAVDDCHHDVYLIDYRLGVKTGIELLAEMRQRNCHRPVILLTGQGGSEIDVQAMEAGAADFLEKGRLDATVLDRAIRYALAQHAAEVQLEEKVAARTAELARANEALRESDRRKDEFLTTMAHELRNPLAPILNALEIMRLSAGNPATAERARQMMERQTQHLVRLIDDLLDISRITRGKLVLQLALEPLAGILEAAVETSRPLIDRAGVELRVELPPEPLAVHGDRHRLIQVFSNLLNNAAKYTPAGGSVLLSAARRDAQRVEVRVKDTGAGLPPEAIGKIFDFFTQVDRSLNRTQVGLGIGLSIVKSVVEMHGGTVEASSEGPDRGTELLVTLPLA